MTVRPGKFSIEDSHVFEGYTDGHTWNGFATPSFTKEQAFLVLAEFFGARFTPEDFAKPETRRASGDNCWTYDEKAGVFRVYSKNDETNETGGPEYGVFEIAGEICNLADGKPVRLYDITSGYCWDEEEAGLPSMLVQIDFTPDPGESIYDYPFKDQKVQKDQMITTAYREFKVMVLNEYEQAIRNLPAYCGRREARYQIKVLAENMTSAEIRTLGRSCESYE